MIFSAAKLGILALESMGIYSVLDVASSGQ